VKATAALALGSIAIGNTAHYLPLLLSRVRDTRDTHCASASQVYLLLKALNEFLRLLLAKPATLSSGSPPPAMVGAISCNISVCCYGSTCWMLCLKDGPK
jgi:hypothetical protein